MRILIAEKLLAAHQTKKMCLELGHPALVISDLGLPEVFGNGPVLIIADGSELGRRVSAAAKPLRERTALVLRVLADTEDLERLDPVDIDDFIFAPLTKAALGLRIDLCRRLFEKSLRLAEVRDRLRNAAIHDPLTGAFNRAALTGCVYREVARATRNRDPLALLMCDIDKFKTINDTHGHAVGDEVLRGVVLRLRRVFRPYDHLGRFGGEEFVALLPCCTRQASGELAERARSAIAGESFPTKAGNLVVTASIGAAMLADLESNHRSSDGPEALIELADQAMYRAKALGRDRVEFVTSLS